VRLAWCSLCKPSLGSGLQVQSESGLITKGNLYLLTSADSGTGKSRAFGPIAKPFLEKERLLFQEWKTNDQPRLRAEKGFVEKEIAVFERKAGNAGSQERQDVLNDLATKQKASHAQPQKIGGVKAHLVSPEIAGAYYKLIEALLATYRFAKYPTTIKATPDAEAALVEHHDALVPRRCAGGDLADVTSYVSRWNEQAWRIGVCLHAAKHGANAAGRELELETVQRAIRLADWFASQQLEILSASRKKAKQDLQDRVLALLMDHPQGITARRFVEGESNAQVRRLEPCYRSGREQSTPMKRALHAPPPELAKAEAMRPEKRRLKRNKHQRWGSRVGDHSGALILKDWKAAENRSRE